MTEKLEPYWNGKNLKELYKDEVSAYCVHALVSKINDRLHTEDIIIRAPHGGFTYLNVVLLKGRRHSFVVRNDTFTKLYSTMGDYSKVADHLYKELAVAPILEDTWKAMLYKTEC